MGVAIKISLVLCGKSNVEEYHRLLPDNYFNGCRLDLFSQEIESMRKEASKRHHGLKGWEEYIRIAAIDTETGKTIL